LSYEYGGPPFSYDDANVFFERLMRKTRTARPQYAWGAVHGANLAMALGYSRISFIEFGVAGGNGLVALESMAQELEGAFGITIDVHGFDAEVGLPESKDYRDTPNLWRGGFYPMDKEKLQQRLKRARIHLGMVEESVDEFVRSKPAPVAFVVFDLCFYSSTMKAFRIFDADEAMLLPRVHCFFRNIFGRSFGDHNGERLAMADFNTSHATRKISKIYGLQYYLRQEILRWVEHYYMAHVLDHRLYGEYDGLIREAALDLGES
jgi:hypothetical protein